MCFLSLHPSAHWLIVFYIFFNFASTFLLFSSFSSFTKNMKKHILTRVWSVQYAKAGQNIQQIWFTIAVSFEGGGGGESVVFLGNGVGGTPKGTNGHSNGGDGRARDGVIVR